MENILALNSYAKSQYSLCVELTAKRGLEAANIKACGFYYSIHENYSKPFKDALTK